MASHPNEPVVHNFTNLLHHIENVTIESQRNLNNFGDRMRKCVSSQGGNPLKYELIPPRYLLKHRGYAVCRHCAINAHNVGEGKSSNLTEYCNEQNVQQHLAKLHASDKVQMRRSVEAMKDKQNTAMNHQQTYLTIELNGCLIKAINKIIETIKATRDLQFVSGDLYPNLADDIKLLHHLYERLRTYNTEVHRIKDGREHRTNNQQILNVGAVKFTNPLILNGQPTSETNVSISDKVVAPSGGKKAEDESLRAQNETKPFIQQANDVLVGGKQPTQHFVIRPMEKENITVQVKRTMSATSICTLERRESSASRTRPQMGPLWTKEDYVKYLDT